MQAHDRDASRSPDLKRSEEGGMLNHPSGDKRFKLLDAAMKKHQFQAHALWRFCTQPRNCSDSCKQIC